MCKRTGSLQSVYQDLGFDLDREQKWCANFSSGLIETNHKTGFVISQDEVVKVWFVAAGNKTEIGHRPSCSQIQEDQTPVCWLEQKLQLSVGCRWGQDRDEETGNQPQQRTGATQLNCACPPLRFISHLPLPEQCMPMATSTSAMVLSQLWKLR